MYLDPKQLRQAVIESQAIGTLTPELVAMLARLVTEAGRRWPMLSAEDTTQDVYLVVLRNLWRLDPAANVFSYLTQIVRNEVSKRYREAVNRDRLAQRYYQDRGGR